MDEQIRSSNQTVVMAEEMDTSASEILKAESEKFSIPRCHPLFSVFVVFDLRCFYRHSQHQHRLFVPPCELIGHHLSEGDIEIRPSRPICAPCGLSNQLVTDRQTDRPTDRPMDTASHRCVLAHLKRQ